MWEIVVGITVPDGRTGKHSFGIFGGVGDAGDHSVTLDIPFPRAEYGTYAVTLFEPNVEEFGGPASMACTVSHPQRTALPPVANSARLRVIAIEGGEQAVTFATYFPDGTV